jgi:hypothetical protein
MNGALADRTTPGDLPLDVQRNLVLWKSFRGIAITIPGLGDN